ncbi:MAG: hypothetical protein V1742_05390 [Pseudomonadota bacterium]
MELDYAILRQDLKRYQEKHGGRGQGAWARLAELSGLSDATVSRIANGKSGKPSIGSWWSLHLAARDEIRKPQFLQTDESTDPEPAPAGRRHAPDQALSQPVEEAIGQLLEQIDSLQQVRFNAARMRREVESLAEIADQLKLAAVKAEYEAARTGGQGRIFPEFIDLILKLTRPLQTLSDGLNQIAALAPGSHLEAINSFLHPGFNLKSAE